MLTISISSFCSRGRLLKIHSCCSFTVLQPEYFHDASINHACYEIFIKPQIALVHNQCPPDVHANRTLFAKITSCPYLLVGCCSETNAKTWKSVVLLALPTQYYTGHCTGETAMAILSPIMGERLHSLSTGMQLEF